MTFRFDITEAEFSEYLQHFYQKRFTFSFNSKTWIYVAFAVFIIGVNIYSSVSRSDNPEKLNAFVSNLISWGILVAILGVAWFLVMRFAFRTPKAGQSNSKIWLYVVVGIVAFLGFLYYLDSSAVVVEGEEEQPSYLQPILSWLLMLGLIAISWIFIMRRLTKSAKIKPQDHETVLGMREMTFSDDRIESKGATVESNYRWEAIKKWEQTMNLYLLYITENSAFIVPKRIFQSTEQAAEFEQMLRRKLPNLTSDKYLDA